MWSFDGEYKQKPKQSLRGASRTLNRSALLNKLKNEREEREEVRKKEASAIQIQKWLRGELCRIKMRRHLRSCCDIAASRAMSDGLKKDDAERITAMLIRIFNKNLDGQRLVNICQLLIKEKVSMTLWICQDFKKWSYLIPRIIAMSLEVITIKDNTLSYASALRLLEVIINPESWNHKLSSKDQHTFLSITLRFLLINGFYRNMSELICTRVPVIYEPTVISPVPLAESLINLMLKPLLFFGTNENYIDLSTLYFELGQHIFGLSSRSQIRNFVLPAISAQKNINPKIFLNIFNYLADDNNFNSMLSFPPPAILVSLLTLVPPSSDSRLGLTLGNYIKVLANLMGHTTCYLPHDPSSMEEDSDEEEEDEDIQMNKPVDEQLQQMAADCLSDINGTDRVIWLLGQIEDKVNPEVLLYLSRLIHHLLTAPGFQLHQCRLLYSLVASKHLLRSLWTVLTSLKQGSPLPGQTVYQNAFGAKTEGPELIQILARGAPLTHVERDALVPLLATFCATLMASISTLHDSEFLGEPDEAYKAIFQNKSTMNVRQFPFSVEEIIKMSATLKDVCVGLAELAHPDMRMSALADASYTTMWAHCFKVCVSVTRQIQLRDTRRNFCPEGHWVSSRVSLPVNNYSQTIAFVPRTRRRQRRLFMPQRWLTKDELELEGPPLSISEQRRATILQELPFVFDFESRMKMFSTLVANDRNQNQYEANFNFGPFINITIRRTHIYEDAFDKLSSTNEPNLRLRMRVRLMNMAGMDEAGIDGGGIFREFLSELLKTAFDPTRGFFLMTRDNTIYPNPSAHLVNEDFQNHYYFIGRMLGKALYENLLVEVPLAGFFLSKLLLRSSSSVEFHHLDSLDPELCRNLLYLKTYEGDVQDLGLDFTVLNSELGQNTVEELIPNGANVPVTKERRIEYIYRMADYKLNKQIAKQCDAFRKGVMDVVSAKWLQMFDWRELQMMISGAAIPIDVGDLALNCKYGGTYSAEHPTIVSFWKVVEDFDESQKRQLLKFVTSGTRPPLLGFKDLQPAFCIQPSGTEERLPSASTCMNLLKLPVYKDKETLREKLLYAITSSAGFEMS